MKKLILISTSILALFSCQKVIDVDLNESNPVIVIEANYRAEDSTVLVKITQTSNYFDNSASPEITTANVTIIDQAGNPTVIPSIGNGLYELTAYAPVFNTNYTLTAVNNGESYSATCSMKAPVQLEDITYQYFDGFFGSDGGYVPFLNYLDPQNSEDYYAIILSRNDTLYNSLNDIFLQDDMLTNGNFVERPLFGNSFYQLDDSVHMELRTIDKRIFNYIAEAQSIAGGQNSAAPGNPTNNWSNGALGYFNAYSSSRKSVIIE